MLVLTERLIARLYGACSGIRAQHCERSEGGISTRARRACGGRAVRTKLVLQRLDLALCLDELELGGERVDIYSCATHAQRKVLSGVASH